MHLVSFIIKKFVTMQHGHMNVKNFRDYVDWINAAQDKAQWRVVRMQ